MATTLAAPAAGAVGIAGDSAALYAAADEMSATARDYFNAADAIAAHGRAVTAHWIGDASEAAGRHIATLATRVQVGSEVYTAAATAIRTYAGELAAAQDAWNTANAQAATAATDLDRAHQQATAAAAMSTAETTGQPDPTAQAAQSRATDQAATAITAASTALSGAHEDLAAAVAAAAAANQRAAEAITACCEQLTAMDGGPSTTSSQTLAQAPPWPSALAGATSTTAASYGATSATTPAQRDQSAWDGTVEWAEGAENWLEDNSGTIADVLGTAALISAFIPGVDLALTPILGALSASAGLMAAHHAYADGDEAEGDQQILMAGLSIVPDGRMLGEGLQAGKALTEADEVAEATRTAARTNSAATTTTSNTLTGPVHVRTPPNPTPEEVEGARLYAEKAQEAVEAGALSSVGRVSTKGSLARRAQAAAEREKRRAQKEGREYQGVAGHVPDSTWMGRPEPHSWLDLPSRVNSSVAGQANGYPLGYKPTEFIFIEP